MRHQPAVGVHPFLDVGQVAAFDDAVQPFGAPHQHAGSTAGQRIGHQLPRRLGERPPVEQFDVTGRISQQQFDRLGLARVVVGIADKSPKARLAQARFLVSARCVKAPGAGFPVQKIAAVVRDHDLLAEPVVTVRSAALAFPAPHADQRQQCQQCVVEIGAFAQVRGVGGNRQIVEGRDVAGRGRLGALGRGSHSVVAQGVGTGRSGVLFGTHDSSVMSR